MEGIRELDLGLEQPDEKTRAMYSMHAYREGEARAGRLQYLTSLDAKQAAATKALRELISKAYKYNGSDVTNRPLVCTPCAGDYGCITFWVICVEGSPPRGTILARPTDYGEAFFVDGRKTRRLGVQQLAVFWRFVDAVLGGRGYRLIEKVVPVVVAEHMR